MNDTVRLLAVSLALALVPAGAPEPLKAVRVGRLYTGREVLSPGVVLFEKGKVSAVGRDLPIPAGPGRVVDMPDRKSVV